MNRLAALLVVLALAVRLAVPTGWMPGEKSFQLTLCTGVDTQTVWMDSKGKLHKQKPHSGEDQKQKPCAFGGALAFAVPAGFVPESMAMPPVSIAPAFTVAVSIGQGLAAPPPPATGPPLFI